MRKIIAQLERKVKDLEYTISTLMAHWKPNVDAQFGPMS